MTDIVERLRAAIRTASNDDYSKAETEMRRRHVERLNTTEAAIDEIESLRAENVQLREERVTMREALGELLLLVQESIQLGR